MKRIWLNDVWISGHLIKLIILCYLCIQIFFEMKWNPIFRHMSKRETQEDCSEFWDALVICWREMCTMSFLLSFLWFFLAHVLVLTCSCLSSCLWLPSILFLSSCSCARSFSSYCSYFLMFKLFFSLAHILCLSWIGFRLWTV